MTATQNKLASLDSNKFIFADTDPDSAADGKILIARKTEVITRNFTINNVYNKFYFWYAMPDIVSDIYFDTVPGTSILVEGTLTFSSYTTGYVTLLPGVLEDSEGTKYHLNRHDFAFMDNTGFTVSTDCDITDASSGIKIIRSTDGAISTKFSVVYDFPTVENLSKQCPGVVAFENETSSEGHFFIDQDQTVAITCTVYCD